MIEATREQFRALERDRNDLLEVLRSRDELDLRAPGADGGWSALEVIDHLMRAEEGSLTYIGKKMIDPASIANAGIGSKLRSMALRIALRLPLRYRAPILVASPKSAESLTDAISRWDQIRKAMGELIEEFPEELQGRAVFRHPVAGRIDLLETMRFHRAHLARHRGQIERGLSGPR